MKFKAIEVVEGDPGTFPQTEYVCLHFDRDADEWHVDAAIPSEGGLRWESSNRMVSRADLHVPLDFDELKDKWTRVDSWDSGTFPDAGSSERIYLAAVEDELYVAFVDVCEKKVMCDWRRGRHYGERMEMVPAWFKADDGELIRYDILNDEDFEIQDGDEWIPLEIEL
jgi:hypothetical protein